MTARVASLVLFVLFLSQGESLLVPYAQLATPAEGSITRGGMRCIVTGGSSGIGEAICKELGKRGCQVFITGRNEEKLSDVQKAVVESGGRAAGGVGDVRNEADVKRLFREASTFFGGDSPGCDLLVASAGIGRFGPIASLSEEDFDATFATNVKGVWLWAREVVPKMKEAGKGQVIFVSSVAGLRKFPGCSVYGGSKWAVEGIAGSLREECKGTGVKIASLAPGSVATPWWMETSRGGKPEAASTEQLAKFLQPQDVASAAMTIVDQASSSNIESLVLDPAGA
eukprot:CAMPEP_0173386620 /NCGR_PEP_ID=MMETSP1356-20130122/9208_1 /TAXON_ID=77927 ORGANISM="Hemiselmis virescens, Strain PCC157" /NCGR_SAMPLE_ID=MMETSP1356 /ASSEMBLY_ACC=CAM_ASM_000847 /LENGTH=283 /DNA_ID=CAMNT_0014342925 /DNA_START=127 /DNA_END=978 /DNA_ORIENTATION=+